MQTELLRKQFEQQLQLNHFQKELQKSSGNINSLVAQLSAEREGEVKRREEALTGKEREIEQRRARIQERRMEMEARRRKIESETDMIGVLIRDEQGEYERLRADAKRAIETEETAHYTTQIRQSRSQQIEAEVDTKRLKVERERLSTLI